MANLNNAFEVKQSFKSARALFLSSLQSLEILCFFRDFFSCCVSLSAFILYLSYYVRQEFLLKFLHLYVTWLLLLFAHSVI